MLPLPTMEANKDFDLVFEVARQLEAFGINRFASCKQFKNSSDATCNNPLQHTH